MHPSSRQIHRACHAHRGTSAQGHQGLHRRSLARRGATARTKQTSPRVHGVAHHHRGPLSWGTAPAPLSGPSMRTLSPSPLTAPPASRGRCAQVVICPPGPTAQRDQATRARSSYDPSAHARWGPTSSTIQVARPALQAASAQVGPRCPRVASHPTHRQAQPPRTLAPASRGTTSWVMCAPSARWTATAPTRTQSLPATLHPRHSQHRGQHRDAHALLGTPGP